jgi:hypothetical protein
MKIVLRLAFMLAVLCATVATSLAQQGKIKGFVYDKATGEPVLFTSVYLKGTSLGAATDVNGYYLISNIPPGEYTLMVTYLGFDTVKVAVSVAAKALVAQNLFLEKSSVKLTEVQISADREEATTEVRTSVTKLTPKEMKQLPSVSGESDLATGAPSSARCGIYW